MDKTNRLLAKGKLEDAIALLEERVGSVEFPDQVTATRRFLETLYVEQLEPAPCRTIAVHIDDLTQTPVYIWVRLFERVPNRNHNDWWDHEVSAVSEGDMQLPVSEFDRPEEGELAMLYGFRMFLRACQELREMRHPVGSAALYGSIGEGGWFPMLKRVEAFPCNVDYADVVRAAQEAFDGGQAGRAMSLLRRLHSRRIPLPLARQGQELLRRWQARAEAAIQGDDEKDLAVKLEELLTFGTTFPDFVRLHDALLDARAELLVSRKRLRPALLLLHRSKSDRALVLEKSILASLGWKNTRRVNYEPYHYFFREDGEVCRYGLLRVSEKAVTVDKEVQVPARLLARLEEAVTFECPSPERFSRALSEAAFLAFQDGHGGWAAHLTRWALQLDPENLVARRSQEALAAKGASESGREKGWLEPLLAYGTVARHTLEGANLD